MHQHFNQQIMDACTFTVYFLIACLQTGEQHQPRLPTNGPTLTEMKYIIQFGFILFWSMDSKSRNKAAPFVISSLGTRLCLLLTTLQDPVIDNLWTRDARSMIFWTFDSLWQALYPYQALSTICIMETQLLY